MRSDNIWYNMNIDEFLVLLAALGVRKWYGFGTRSGKMPDSTENVNRLLADLYQNEVISFDDDELVLESGYRKLFDVLKSSEKCYLAVSSRKRKKKLLSYCGGDSVVVCGGDQATPDMIRMAIIPKSDWPYFITSEMLGFDRISGGQVRLSDTDLHTLTSGTIKSSDAALLPGVVSVFDEVDVSKGTTKERLTVREKGLMQYMVYEKAGREDLSVMEGGLSETERFLTKWALQ